MRLQVTTLNLMVFVNGLSSGTDILNSFRSAFGIPSLSSLSPAWARAVKDVLHPSMKAGEVERHASHNGLPPIAYVACTDECTQSSPYRRMVVCLFCAG